jgi:hypothetical protein
MADVGTAATFANGEVVGGACSNAGSDTTESKNIAPSGGRGGGHPLPVVGVVLGSMVGQQWVQWRWWQEC